MGTLESAGYQYLRKLGQTYDKAKTTQGVSTPQIEDRKEVSELVAGAKDIAAELATTRGISKREAESIVKDVVEIMSTKIVEGGVSFKGVFTIKPKTVKGRSGSFKGVDWKTEDHKTLSIVPGNTMKFELNKG